jgi:hypothetical protein
MSAGEGVASLAAGAGCGTGEGAPVPPAHLGTPHIVVDVLDDGRERARVYVNGRIVAVTYDDSGLAFQESGRPVGTPIV